MNAFIFNSMTIENAGGGNAITYNVLSGENRSVNIGYVASMVDDDEELASQKTVELSIDTYDLDITSDTRITKDASSIASPCRVTLNSVVGGVSIMVDSIRLRLVQKVGDRYCHTVAGKKSASMMTNSQWFRFQVQLAGGTVVDLKSLSILNSVFGATLICPCNSGAEGLLYYSDSSSPLITFT
jgi:hypothetical protein